MKSINIEEIKIMIVVILVAILVSLCGDYRQENEALKIEIETLKKETQKELEKTKVAKDYWVKKSEALESEKNQVEKSLTSKIEALKGSVKNSLKEKCSNDEMEVTKSAYQKEGRYVHIERINQVLRGN